jgi:hypothetical protein
VLTTVSYAALIALHTKVTWGMWWWRDLTHGDTANYFAAAWGWHTRGTNRITFSPLYTAFYGTFLFFSQDAYVVTVAHRLVASLLASLLVLAVARTLLSAPVAWLVAAWWTVLPVNYDTLYEVHLFSVIPVLVVYWLLLGGEARWRRGVSLAIMLALPVILRNELALAALLMLGAFTAWEYRAWTRREAGWGPRIRRAYGIPLAGCLLVLAGTYATSEIKAPVLGWAFTAKQTLNLCHVYAFGYQQRDPAWTRSPWLECYGLMEATFGTPQPTVLQAIRANPRALAEHVAWNATLIPNGLQLLLFDRMSGAVNPDYVRVKSRVRWVLPASLALLALLVTGWWQLWRAAARWQEVVGRHAQGWVAVLTVCAVGLFVMLTQRPRPAYLFGTSVAVMLAVGVAVETLARRWLAGRESAWLVSVVGLGLVLAPAGHAGRAGDGRRPLLDEYRRLQRVVDRIQVPGRVLVDLGQATSLCFYLTVPGRPRCQGLHYHRLRPAVAGGRPWAEVLAEHGATMLYADEAVTADPIMADFLASPARWGWRVVVDGSSRRGRWVLLERA